MKMKKTLLMGAISCALLLPTTAFAANSTDSATNPASNQQSQPSFTAKTLQTTSFQVTGNITPISTPTTDYTSNTNKIDISNLSNQKNYNSISDGTQTISFSSPMVKLHVPDFWNAHWGPATESQTPDILFSNFMNEVTLNLSQPSNTFGFELDPNLYGTANFTVDYFSGTTLLGSLTQSVTTSTDNTSDIKVFGATSDTPIDRVVIHSASGDALGFAIAQIRYGNLDNKAPESNATLSVVNNQLSVKLSATDDKTGVEKTQYRINGKDWKTYTGPVSLKFDEQLQFRSVDNYGNIENARTLGVVKNGYQLENVYISTSKGLVGPLNKTMTNSQEFLLFILTLSR
ncbi:OmpL47-type beta-barrel domain-containing protein [Neobacillus sp. NPDC093127]|uniref:OmpL47-type beta-barrel domain-containing protein n=1 Tax=Neobacillus sp. NPDC093127 TaxID=3364296 RepID=UPI003809B244